MGIVIGTYCSVAKRNTYIYPKNIPGYITPDPQILTEDEQRFTFKYTPIEYSKIYCFYFENAGRMLDVEYFKEYLRALKMHKESTDNTNYEKMKRKFIKNIKDIKKFKSMLESKN